MVTDEVAKGDLSEYDNYENNTPLSNFIKESLRLYGPAALSFPRQAVKDFKLGKYRIYKGTRFFIPYTNFHHNDAYHTRAMSFDWERFDSEKKSLQRSKPASFMPFGLGKRSCIGKYLGELMLKMMLVNITKKFELRAVSDYEPGVELGLTYGLSDCYLRVKPRKVE